MKLIVALLFVIINAYVATAAMTYGGRYSIQELYSVVANGFGQFTQKCKTSELLQTRALATFVNKNNALDVTTNYEQFLIDTTTNTYYMIRNGYNVLRKFEESDFDTFDSQVPFAVSNSSAAAFRFHWRPYYWTYSMNFLNNLVLYKDEIGIYLRGKAKNSYFQVVNHPDGKSIMIKRLGTNTCLQIESVVKIQIPPLSGFMRTCNVDEPTQMFKWDGRYLRQKYEGKVYNVCFFLSSNSNKLVGNTNSRSAKGNIIMRTPDTRQLQACQLWMKEAGYERDMSTTPASIIPVEEWYSARTLRDDDVGLQAALLAADYRFAWAGASTLSMSMIAMVFCIMVHFLL